MRRFYFYIIIFASLLTVPAFAEEGQSDEKSESAISRSEKLQQEIEERRLAYKKRKEYIRLNSDYIATKFLCVDEHNKPLLHANTPDYADVRFYEDYLSIRFFRDGKQSGHAQGEIELEKKFRDYEITSETSSGLGCFMQGCKYSVGKSTGKPGDHQIRLEINQKMTRFCRNALDETEKQYIYLTRRDIFEANGSVITDSLPSEFEYKPVKDHIKTRVSGK